MKLFGGKYRVLTVFCVSVGIAMAQTPPPRQLTLLTPTSPDFLAALQTNYPGITDLPDFSKVMPYLTILRNDTPYSVDAYCVLYTWQPSDSAQIDPACLRFVYDDLAPPGMREGKPMKPGEVNLLGPLDLSYTPYGYMTAGKRSSQVISGLANFLSYAQVPLPSFVVIDVAVYSDGGYSGSDSRHIFEIYQARSDAAKDEAKKVLSLLKVGAAMEAITSQLQKDIDGQFATSEYPDGSAHRYYLVEYQQRCGAEAQKYLSLQKGFGASVLRIHAEQILRSPAIVFSPLAEKTQ